MESSIESQMKFICQLETMTPAPYSTPAETHVLGSEWRNALTPARGKKGAAYMSLDIVEKEHNGLSTVCKVRSIGVDGLAAANPTLHALAVQSGNVIITGGQGMCGVGKVVNVVATVKPLVVFPVNSVKVHCIHDFSNNVCSVYSFDSKGNLLSYLQTKVGNVTLASDPTQKSVLAAIIGERPAADGSSSSVYNEVYKYTDTQLEDIWAAEFSNTLEVAKTAIATKSYPKDDNDPTGNLAMMDDLVPLIQASMDTVPKGHSLFACVKDVARAVNVVPKAQA